MGVAGLWSANKPDPSLTRRFVRMRQIGILQKAGHSALASALLLVSLGQARSTFGQPKSLEERQPLEMVFADSIVPQDRHETMLTTGVWYFRHGSLHSASLTQKVEWGISDQLQVATFVQLVNSSNSLGSTKTGLGDVEIGARYSWITVGSEFTHVALAFDAGIPTGNPRRALGEGAYSLSPSVLISRELGQGKYQLFTTTGLELIAKRRRLDPSQDTPHNSIFSNGGLSLHAFHGWAIGEVSFSSNRWSGGNETRFVLTPAYVWRPAKRSELLVGIPIGLTSSTDRVGGVVKFTFELGGKPD